MWQLNELNTYCVGVYQSDVQKVFKQSQLINSEHAAGEFTNIKRPSFLHYPLLPLLCHSFLLWRNSPNNHSRSRRITIIINGSSFRLNLADIICPSTATRSTWNGNFCGGSLVLINWRRRGGRSGTGGCLGGEQNMPENIPLCAFILTQFLATSASLWPMATNHHHFFGFFSFSSQSNYLSSI